MPGIGGDWATLSSQNERLMRAADSEVRQADNGPVSPEPARWAELASQRERLIELSDPLYLLAASPQQPSGFRLAASTA
jgi:hypothetical protein